jgi:2-hydroxychromene-2-carboxylate isomerase
MLQVEFFFDFSCPWTYLACTRLREAAMRTGATIVWKAFALADLRPEPDRRETRLAADAACASWQLRDLQAWADYCDLSLQLPADWPSPAALALRGAVVAAEQGRAEAFVPRTFRALYGEGRDIADTAVLQEIAASSGLNIADFERALSDQASAAVCQANAAELQARGGFRSATLFVGEQMFCGNSRVPLVEFALAQASGRQFVMPGQHG